MPFPEWMRDYAVSFHFVVADGKREEQALLPKMRVSEKSVSLTCLPVGYEPRNSTTEDARPYGVYFNINLDLDDRPYELRTAFLGTDYLDQLRTFLSEPKNSAQCLTIRDEDGCLEFDFTWQKDQLLMLEGWSPAPSIRDTEQVNEVFPFIHQVHFKGIISHDSVSSTLLQLSQLLERLECTFHSAEE